MKKIFCITRGSYIGGAELVTLKVLSGLQKKGNEVFCLANGWGDGDFQRRLSELRIPYQNLKLGWFYLRKPFWTLDTLIQLPRALYKAVRLLSKMPHDLLYTDSYRQISLLYFWVRKPVIFHVHDPMSNDKQFRWLLPKIDTKISSYIAVSEFIQQDLIHAGVKPEKIVLVYNGVNIPAAPLPICSKKEGTLNLGIVGQIIPRKGHEDLIKALALVKQQGQNNFHLIIVGKGEASFEEKLKALIVHKNLSEQISWRGFKRSLLEIYEGIDVVVAPTKNAEPFGLIAIEANALGIPVIAPNKGGLAEIIEHRLNGYLFESQNVKALAHTINQFSQMTESDLKKMGNAGRQKVIQHFSTDAMYNQIHRIIQQL